MTPSAPTSPCDKLLICAVVLVVLTCIVASALLAWHGQSSVIAAFIGVAMAALGILSPSPLKQHGQNGDAPAQPPAVTATTTTGDVSVTTPSASPAVPAVPSADGGGEPAP